MQLASRALAASAAALSAPRAAKCAVPAPVAVSASRSKAVAPTRRSQGPGRQVSVKVAAPESPASSGEVIVNFDNTTDSGYTVISVQANNKPGLLTSITALFRDLGVDVGKAVVEGDEDRINDKFYVRSLSGGKLSEDKAADCVKALDVLLRSKPTGTEATRPKFENTAATGGTGKARLYTLMDTYMKNDVLSIQEDIVNHVEYTLARSRVNFDNFEAYQATSFSLRDRLIERWNDTQTWFKEKDPKRVYYLSMEFLMGRSLLNTLYNLDIKESYQEALAELGYDLETLADLERDAALGNGGLGRLAACFLDSMATLNLPAWGYGIRYQYGMFRQTIQNGFQHEQPDYWLTFGNPWEIERLIVSYPIKFYGHVSVVNEDGRQLFRWNAGETVTAVAYDNPIPGFGTRNCINLRLWAAKPSKEFDLEAFNTGDYVAAILSKQRAETLSSVLYPDDRTYEGKELRLKQQHFFVSATIQDCVRRYRDAHPNDWEQFPEKVAFQLNDTHPTIAVAELMRVLMDDHKLGWTKSWDICNKVFAFTNHTVLPEALERWPVALIEKLLPRHMQIIYDINWRFLQTVRNKFGDDWERISRMSVIEEQPNGEKMVRMAFMAVVASHTVNGVAAIHSEIIKETIFKDFYELWPNKFQNKTNGVTQRRWLAFCNPPLRQLITKKLGNDDWTLHLDNLRELRKYANDPEFQTEWRGVKSEAKKKAAALIHRLTGVRVSTDAMFDIQIKRIHEYKRQLLNVLGIIYRYDQIKKMTPQQRKSVVPRVCVIGGKAAPGYEMAKRIIKLICAVGDKINQDPDMGDLLKLVFLPDYNVSSAEVIIPATELSQHISTAGTEASGTSNMKFTMNGSLIIGTLDGANVEIAEEIGDENIFIFGAKAHEVARLRAERRNLHVDERFNHVVNMIRTGHFGWEDYFGPVVDAITTGGDYYLVANDFPGYLETQFRADEVYKNQTEWTRMSIMATAGGGKFSTDRTIAEYARDIWHAEPCQVPQPEAKSKSKPASS
uniref:Alpha-1,4 glucan phosphorylase n=1 Tax=Chlamydomonas reinhardtii TaxID=3055 RepID=Q2VA41_CHLRE|nr:PhoB [Chlamydomonas reinhardtii]ABB88568.1 PhoB [Chlamydomonas reinhardtii]